jgi:cytochrome c oxidase subunit 5a
LTCLLPCKLECGGYALPIVSPLSGSKPVPPSITLPPKLTNIVTGIKAKVENKTQYEQYLQELKPLREELGIPLKEDLYPEESN